MSGPPKTLLQKSLSFSLPPLVGIAIGLVAVSTASILIRFAQKEAPSLTIAVYRLSLASLLLAPLALTRHRQEIIGLQTADVGLVMLSGLLLGAHFAAWISSLAYTSVTASVVLVSTSPLFVALFSALWLRESVPRQTWAGVGLTSLGSMIIGAGDAGAGRLPLLGDGLALVGALTVAGYLAIGRKLRPKLSLISYVFMVYSVAALGLLVTVVLTRQPLTGFPPQTYLFLLALALVPQLIGHSSFNWALRFLPATFVAVTVLGEPVGSSMLAWIILQEPPTGLEGLGGGLILTGIFVVSRARA